MKPLAALLGVLLLALAACGPRSTEPQPPEIVYGEEVCYACGMLISDPKFASATVLASGESLAFDDAGEMFSYHMNHPEKQVAAWFVHDYGTEDWLRGETAFYVQSDSLHTPMGGGLAAFGTREAAEAFAATVDGHVHTFDEIRVEVHLTEHGP